MASQLFPKEDVPALKAWIVKRLENTCVDSIYLFCASARPSEATSMC